MILKIPVEIYKTSVFIYEGDDLDNFKKHFISIVGKKDRNIKYLELDQGTEARTLNHNSGVSFIIFPTDPQAGTIAHEFAHVVFYMLDSRGIKLKASSEESYCYFLGYLVKKYTELKAKQINKTNKKSKVESS